MKRQKPQAPRQGPKILVVAPDRASGEGVAAYLGKDGYSVTVSVDHELGFSQARVLHPVLVIVEFANLKPAGLVAAVSWCKRLRADAALTETPIIVVGESRGEAAVTAILNAGADDYLVRPVRPREVSARVRAILRRSLPSDHRDERRCVVVGSVQLDLDSYEVFESGRPVVLTLAEFRLLHVMMERPGWVFSRQQLLDQITQGEATIVGRNIDVHVLALRQKLGVSAAMIVTVRGTGYKVAPV